MVLGYLVLNPLRRSIRKSFGKFLFHVSSFVEGELFSLDGVTSDSIIIRHSDSVLELSSQSISVLASFRTLG